MTTLRTPEYLVLVRELHCSLLKHNPAARLIVAAVAGDLDAAIIAQVQNFTEYREIKDVPIINSRRGSCCLTVHLSYAVFNLIWLHEGQPVAKIIILLVWDALW